MTEAMKECGGCAYWEPMTMEYGRCERPRDVEDYVVWSLCEGDKPQSVFTRDRFGCVLWRGYGTRIKR